MVKWYKEEDIWQYEAVFYDDIDGNLRTAPMTALGAFNQEKADGSFYFRDMAFPKFVLGNTIFAVYNGKYDGAGNTARAPHYVFMMKDTDPSDPSLVYTYSGDDFMAGGVFGGKLYLIEEAGDAMKLTVIDQNGNIT